MLLEDESQKGSGTSYNDMLQIHHLNRNTTSEEIMRAFYNPATIGKVHYIGASSMYTWECVKLHFVARLTG